MSRLFLAALGLALGLVACQGPSSRQAPSPEGQGQLFIIGGGARPEALLRDLLGSSGLDTGGYALVLPFASEEPDSAAHYATAQFLPLGIGAERLHTLFWPAGRPAPASLLDTLRGARLIYLTGGDQNRFMRHIAGTGIAEAIAGAYAQGATIAGTSAGAAVMSRLMITGNERKHPEYTGEYRSIEADNIEIGEGLGLFPQAIVDQHFIYRMRMNRLISVALEQPGYWCFGIDEGTALVLRGDSLRVSGQSQVLALRYPAGQVADTLGGLLGGQGLQLDVLLPGTRRKLGDD